MKTKYIIIATIIGLTGCSTVGRCPRCGEAAHFNGKRNQVIGIEHRKFDYIKNGSAAQQEYAMPKVVSTTDSWECSNGHEVQVRH